MKDFLCLERPFGIWSRRPCAPGVGVDPYLLKVVYLYSWSLSKVLQSDYLSGVYMRRLMRLGACRGTVELTSMFWNATND